jgi:ATP synthase protein I
VVSIGDGAASKQRPQRKQRKQRAARDQRDQQRTQERSERRRREEARARAAGLELGWTIASYPIAGLIAYGAIGWLLARVTHVQLLFPLGMVLGIAISVWYVIYRYGRQGAGQPQGDESQEDDSRRKTKGMTGDR